MSSNANRQEAHYHASYARGDDWPLRVTGADCFRAEFERFRRCNVLSYGSFYPDRIYTRLNGKRVLELGFGRGDHALFMARFGAQVLALEVSSSAVEALNAAAEQAGLASALTAVQVQALSALEGEDKFDFVIGKAFLHHLTHEEEAECLDAVRRLLKPDGEARFFESATNSRVLDQLRWLLPVRGRPSVLARRRFAAWKANDPHPDRDNSEAHYRAVVGQFFNDVEIQPKEAFQRFARFLRTGTTGFWRATAAAQKAERFLPDVLHRPLARAQLIVCRRPR